MLPSSDSAEGACRCDRWWECFNAAGTADATQPGTESTDVARKTIAQRRHILELQSSFSAIEACPQPVIAAVHGACVGGGIDLSCACDIRLCSEQAWFTIKEVDIGLCADLGTLQVSSECVIQPSSNPHL